MFPRRSIETPGRRECGTFDRTEKKGGGARLPSETTAVLQGTPGWSPRLLTWG